LALHHWEKYQLPVTVLRLGVLYGEGGRPISRGLAQIGALRLLVGSGHNTLPFTYVENAVDAMLLASISPEAPGQAYNIVDDPQVRMCDVIWQDARLTGEQAVILPVPPGLLSMASYFLESRRERQHAEIPPVITNYVVRSACRNIAYDTSKAHEQLGWQPEVSLAEGLKRINTV
jgi:nucleoside-diphosphate-sugar epimerase